MSDYAVLNILDYMDVIGEDSLRAALSGFSCPKNQEIEDFMKKNAIEFAKRKMSITYFLIDTEGRILGIFVLAHKALQVMGKGLSGTIKKKLQRYAQICEENLKLLEFYQSEKNRFRIFGERYSEKDDMKYIQLLKIF